jgi:G3E family GTPase
MTKIDIFSGFLGAGKTTLIKKLIADGYKGEQLVLIENEFGEIGIDGGFLRESGIQINEMNSGCICCSLVGDFAEALHKVIDQYHPDRILIEPSGVGKLSDVIHAVQTADTAGAVLNGFTTVADATKVKMYMKNFGEFYNNQIEHASTIILSRTQGMSEEKLAAVVAMLREHNAVATIITTPWDELTGEQILSAMEQKSTLQAELAQLAAETAKADAEEHEHEHHHHHDHDEDEDEHEHHHHHDHDEDEDEHEHHHHHDHDHHHHHHHADEIFDSWGKETTRKFTAAEIENALAALQDEAKYGIVLRAKGIVAGEDGSWIHFDYVPGCPDVRTGSAEIIGRLCVIGSKLDEAAVAALFGVN